MLRELEGFGGVLFTRHKEVEAKATECRAGWQEVPTGGE